MTSHVSCNKSYDTVYINGVYKSSSLCTIHVHDRSFVLGDGIYDVIACIDDHIIDLKDHIMRSKKCIEALSMTLSLSDCEFEKIFRNLIRYNDASGFYMIYMHISRGEFPIRMHSIPDNIQSNLYITLQQSHYASPINQLITRTCITHKDIRWSMPYIKSTSLQANVILKKIAHDHHADEAILIDHNGHITECATCNLFIIKDNILITRRNDGSILPGITRKKVLEIAEKLEIEIQERLFSEQELLLADEIFQTSALIFVCAITEVNKQLINNGKIGVYTKTLYQEYIQYAKQDISQKETPKAIRCTV